MEQNTNSPRPIPTPPAPTAKKDSPLKIATIILLALGGLFLLPAIVLMTGLARFSSEYFATPEIDEQVEKRMIEERLRRRYGKKFTVSDVTAKGPEYLGDSRSINAKAQPEDDPTITVNIGKDLDRDSVYRDDYLTTIWSLQDKQAITPEFKRIFGYIPQFSSGIAIGRQFNTDYQEGRVMSIGEAVEKYNDKVRYDMKIEAKEGGSARDHSEKAFRVIQYMRSRFTNSQGLRYEFTAKDTLYTCNLYEFTYQLIESSRQLEGCWTKKSLTAAAPESKYKIPAKTTNIDGDYLPIVIKLHKDEEAEKVAASSEQYVVRKNDGLAINIAIHRTGFGDRINDDRRRFCSSWVEKNLPVTDSVTVNHIHPPWSKIPVSIGEMIYRSDTTVNKRTVNYILFYKTFTAHVSADTMSPDIDIRDKEFSFKYFVENISAVDGSETR